jgi:hypothetical protein
MHAGPHRSRRVRPRHRLSIAGDISEDDSHPMGRRARSKPPSFSPASANAGQTGTLSSSSPERTVRYPVSPPKNNLDPTDASVRVNSATGQGAEMVRERIPVPGAEECSSSRAHEPQSVFHLSVAERAEVCWQGVQVNLKVAETLPSVSLPGNLSCTVRRSHQSRVWTWSEVKPMDVKYGALPSGMKI